jgi:hypothetical protein
MRRIVLAVVLIAFLALTAAAAWQQGYLGVFASQFETLGGIQVLVDLGIAASLFLVWMWQDAKAAGRNPWPWLLLTLVAGSIGPLVYLLLYKSARD